MNAVHWTFAPLQRAVCVCGRCDGGAGANTLASWQERTVAVAAASSPVGLVVMGVRHVGIVLWLVLSSRDSYITVVPLQ